MIQLIPEGPEIHEDVLFDLENNNLVLFCGAGISKRNELPLFDKLVKEVCEKLCVDLKESLLEEPNERRDYDGILDLVEGQEEFSVSPKDLRTEIIKILSDYKGKPDIHKALLDLSALPNNKGHRLVTTNFDRLFFEAGLNPELSDSAPKLSPPRKETWDRLTFLHGVIDEKKDPEGKSLVLTRKDFGLAYFKDDWASHFIIQLFQDFTILFIGYSVDDPVMKYLVSAISYETQKRRKGNKDQGKKNPSIYAFVGYKENELKKQKSKWRSMGIEPILYKIKAEDDHYFLYKTIKVWASLKKMSLRRKKRLLTKIIKNPYREPNKGIAKTIIFFLKSDERLAKLFSEEKQSFHTSWLNPMLENGLLDKFVGPFNEGYRFDAPVLLWEPLSKDLKYNSKSIPYIASWLCHHLDKKELIHWAINQGCILHPVLKIRIKRELESRSKNKPPLTEEISLFWETITSDNYDPQKNKEFKVKALIKKLNEK